MEIILLTNNAKPLFNIVSRHAIFFTQPHGYNRFVTKFTLKFGKSEKAVKKILRNDYRVIFFL